MPRGGEATRGRETEEERWKVQEKEGRKEGGPGIIEGKECSMFLLPLRFHSIPPSPSKRRSRGSAFYSCNIARVSQLIPSAIPFYLVPSSSSFSFPPCNPIATLACIASAVFLSVRPCSSPIYSPLASIFFPPIHLYSFHPSVVASLT